jgi:hypothetical protein
MLSCKHANLFGKPNTGVHKLHFGGVALVDNILTVILACALSYIPHSPPVTIWIIFLFLLAMLFHAGFCTKTSVDKWLDKNYNAYIFSSIVIISAILLLILRHLQ